MSVFDLPRLHFAGTATTQLPTGARSGLVDLADNTALTGEHRPFPVTRPAAEYHRELAGLGLLDLPGAHLAGNGHFVVTATVVGAERTPGDPVAADPVLGRSVDLWGHYNEYFATTMNRARVFDVDPASSWTTTLMVGRLCFGRSGRSHEVGYLCTGEVEGFQPPRWHRFDPESRPGCRGGARPRLPRQTVHQFTVDSAALQWPPAAPGHRSPLVDDLRAALAEPGTAGLVVQFALAAPPGPLPTGRPVEWTLTGTIAPWRHGEPRSHPAGRLLSTPPGWPDPPAPLPRQLTVQLGERLVGVNLIGADPHALADQVPPDGRWELRTADGEQLVAVLPGGLGAPDGRLLTVARQGGPAAEDRALRLDWAPAGGARTTVLCERETTVQADQAALIAEHPRHAQDGEQDLTVTVRSLVRGRPAPVTGIRVRQYANPAALPLLGPAELAGLRIARLRAGAPGEDGTAGEKEEDAWAADCLLDTGPDGVGRLVVRGGRAGCARLLLAPPGEPLPEELPPADGQLDRTDGHYDDADALRYWSGAGALALRVLPDDWHLDELPPERITFELLHREVLAYYELTSTFMKEEVFSLADRARVETYARLCWQMSDPGNKSRTYYMPPTRDLSAPRARLLLGYLRARSAPGRLLTRVATPGPRRAGPELTRREDLVAAVRDAVTIELAVTLQYLYAAYSLPTHGAGLAYLRRGQWSAQRLALVCGDGGETLEDSIRSTLLRVAREEMTHFLVVNNLLTALGEPFAFPAIDFGTLNHRLPIPLDFALEGLGPAAVHRFVELEQPDRLLTDPRYGDSRHGDQPHRAATGHPATYHSISELYAAIRHGLRSIPDLFPAKAGPAGGEHHVFLRRSVNARHPDYQLQVDDLASALFAVDFVTEQGEGGVLAPDRPPGEESHHDSFRRLAGLLTTLDPDHGAEPPGPAPRLAYPVLRNPTLRPGNAAQQLITDPLARQVAELGNEAYALMAQLMVQHFAERPAASLRRSPLMNASIEVMNALVRPLAELLVNLPAGVPGRTAGPPFELAGAPHPLAGPPTATRRELGARLERLAYAARSCPLVPDQVLGTLAYLVELFRKDMTHP